MNNLTTEIWLPTFISYSYNKDVLPKIQNIFNSFDWNLVKDDRYQNGYTTFYGGEQLNEMLKNSMVEFCDWVLENCYEIAKRQEVNLGNKKFVITTFWMSRMLQHGSHPKHLHAHSFYSGTYYVNCDSSNAKIKFCDPRLYRQFLPGVYSSEIVEYCPENGKLLLWDSYLEHEVDINQSNSIRDAISFNVGFAK